MPQPKQQPIRWGVLATGHIARTFADALQASEKNTLLGVGSRTLSAAQSFAAKYPSVADHCYGSYQALLDDPDIDAVYISPPHTEHARWALRAIDAGKSVLCEKPMALNHAECMAIVDRAARNGQFLMEAFMYRLHPQMQRVQSLIAEGAIGDVRHIEASFGYHAPFDAGSRLFANELAGGGILDVGCYPLSFARTIVGSEALDIQAHGYLGTTGVDEWSAALLKFANGVSAQIATAVSAQLRNTATIYGSTGQIHLPNPWLPADKQGKWSFELQQGRQTETIHGTDANIYLIEADHVATALHQGQLESPILSWQDSLNNAHALDQWRAQIGLEYEQEKPASHTGPLIGALRQPAQPLESARIKHLDKPVSRLVMGCDNQPSMSHASVMWDNYFEQGGNCFDTAFIYGGGAMETLLGHWHQQRHIREDLVIIGKGAHTPDNYPEAIAPQLDISLERLQTDYVDLYFLHRDNLDLPVGDFVEALNEEVQRGRIRAFGGSNWTLERVQAANEYAQNKGLQGFSAVSNNFSLARMREPIWPGTVACSTAEYMRYLEQSQLALMPWSSQARGFFTPWADQVIAQIDAENPAVTTMQPTVDELRRVWFSEENFQRRERAARLAERYGVSMINIALAYVLRQPFPTFALVGPRLLAETRSCISSLNIPLSKEDIAFLEMG